MNKKIKDLTLAELQNICEGMHSCQECLFSNNLCKKGRLSDVLVRCFYKTNLCDEEVKISSNESQEYYEVEDKAFKNGVYFIDSLHAKREAQVCYKCLLNGEYNLLIRCSSSTRSHFVKLKDYKKTWWLRGEKND